MKHFGVLCALVSAVAALPANITEPTLQNAIIGNITYSGSGCSTNTTTTVLDGNELTLLFDGFQSQLQINGTTNQRDCTSMLSVQAPKGWKMTPEVIRGDFFLYVMEGIGGSIYTEAYFSSNGSKVRFLQYIHCRRNSRGSPPSINIFQSQKEDSFTGYSWGSAYNSHNFSSNPVYSQCGGKVDLTLHSYVRLTSNQSAAQPYDGSLVDVKDYDYMVKWIPCSA